MAAVALLSDLVTPDEVRALLGVDPKELPDSRLDLPVYLRSVKISVGRLDPQRRFWNAYEALPDDNLSDVQQRFADAFQAFVGWKAASLLAVSLPQSSPRSITDGKAGFQRQPDAPMDTIANLNAQLAGAVEDLIGAATELLPAPVVEVAVTGFIGRASLGAADPVTG